MTLSLTLTFHWYDQTANGSKRIEYRVITPMWTKRIWERRTEITHVRFFRGMTATNETFPVDRIDVGPCPIPGWSGTYYRIHFKTP